MRPCKNPKEIPMIRPHSPWLPAFLAATLLLGCSPKVTRVTHDSSIDISGRWNDTDSRLVAEEMVRDALGGAWYPAYAAAHPMPRVIVGTVRNRSHEHIRTETFINDIQRSLINSGKVEFVAGKTEREEIRDEKDDQAGHAQADTRKSQGEESGAALMLLGSFNSIVDQEGGKAVVFYQVDLELVEIESHKKLWIGDKKIKKFVTRSGTRF
jgi:penicillin-binding protein activator